MNARRLRATAYHEAGHAVVAWAVGVRIHSVTIKADEDHAGYVSHARALNAGTWHANDDRMRRTLEREIKISLAGALAQRRAFPGSKWRHGAGSDERSIGDLLAHAFPAKKIGDDGWRAQGHWRALLEIETGWLLSHYWHCVAALAEELLSRISLTGREAKEVILHAHAARLENTLTERVK